MGADRFWETAKTPGAPGFAKKRKLDRINRMDRIFSYHVDPVNPV
jgi:hypothetical protein